MFPNSIRKIFTIWKNVEETVFVSFSFVFRQLLTDYAKLFCYDCPENLTKTYLEKVD